MGNDLYRRIWSAACDKIVEAVKEGEYKEYSLNPEYFFHAGNRNNYTFRTEFEDGICVNCSNSAVARDLVTVLQESSSFKQLSRRRHIVIRMGRDFVLHIEVSKCVQEEFQNNTTPEKEEIQKNTMIDSDETESFNPISDADSKILILGTIPGKESLKKNEYYASKNNSFWKIIAYLFNGGNDFVSYEEKVNCLLRNHIALWDVYSSCIRKGSADSNIKQEIMNDLESFIASHRIKLVVFNGQKALNAFQSTNIDIPFKVVSSSSNANTHLSIDEKIEEWRKAFETL